MPRQRLRSGLSRGRHMACHIIRRYWKRRKHFEQRCPSDTVTSSSLCTGNSARSIIAESLLNALGTDRFRAYSAGSHPGGQGEPAGARLPARDEDRHRRLRAASPGTSSRARTPRAWTWSSPSATRRPAKCCPVWPGMPAKAHWSAPDPAAFMDDPAKAREVIREVFQTMQRRISLLLALPIERLDPDVAAGRRRARSPRG